MDSDCSKQSTDDTSGFEAQALQNLQNDLKEVDLSDSASQFGIFLKTYGEQDGQIHLIFGPMFSGKTSHLLKIIREAKLPGKPKKCMVVTRYNKEMKTHDEYMQTIKPIQCENLEEILPLYGEYDIIVIDEAQFFPEIVEFCEKFANEGKIVYVAACDGTFQRKPFGRVHELVSLAESVTKLTAICHTCGEKAAYTFRVVEGDDILLPGGEKEYEAACRKCHIERTALKENKKGKQSQESSFLDKASLLLNGNEGTLDDKLCNQEQEKALYISKSDKYHHCRKINLN